MAFLELKSVSKGYDGANGTRSEVLRDINADVIALQEVIGAGPAGSGQAEEIGYELHTCLLVSDAAGRALSESRRDKKRTGPRARSLIAAPQLRSLRAARALLLDVALVSVLYVLDVELPVLGEALVVLLLLGEALVSVVVVVVVVEDDGLVVVDDGLIVDELPCVLVSVLVLLGVVVVVVLELVLGLVDVCA